MGAAQARREVAGVECVARADGVEDVGRLGLVFDAATTFKAEGAASADLDDEAGARLQPAGDQHQGRVQVFRARDAARLQLVDEQMVAMRQPAQHFAADGFRPVFGRPAGVQGDGIAAGRGFGEQVGIAAAQLGQQEGRGEEGDGRHLAGQQMLEHMLDRQLLQMAVGGEEVAVTAGVHQADRDGGLAVADLEVAAQALELLGQPLAEVVVADGRDELRALADVAGGQRRVGAGAAGAQLAARHQQLGADAGPAVEGAKNQIDADVANDAELGAEKCAIRVHGRRL